MFAPPLLNDTTTLVFMIVTISVFSEVLMLWLLATIFLMKISSDLQMRLKVEAIPG